MQRTLDFLVNNDTIIAIVFRCDFILDILETEILENMERIVIYLSGKDLRRQDSNYDDNIIFRHIKFFDIFR